MAGLLALWVTSVGLQQYDQQYRIPGHLPGGGKVWENIAYVGGLKRDLFIGTTLQ